jgi:hypothetical protein
MVTASHMYNNPASFNNLLDSTEYETWFLEEVFKITNMNLAIGRLDEFVYHPNGRMSTYKKKCSMNCNSGDWRGGFLEAGAPLIFSTAFKLLDMLIEWVLMENGIPSTPRFVQKINAIKEPVVFPPLIASQPWLKDSFIGLYEQLEPLRGTIIHDRSFRSNNGILEVSSSKHGTTGPVIIFNTDDLRILSNFLVSIQRFLTGTWSIDLFQEKRLRRMVDELAKYHKMPLLGQLQPQLLNVRVYKKEENPIKCDLSEIRKDLAVRFVGMDFLFNLEIISISKDPSTTIAYLVPWNQISDTDNVFTISLDNLAQFTIDFSDDINLIDIAREMD